MEIETIYQNTDGRLVSGPASINDIDKLYIVLDYNENDSKDTWRDKIVFDEEDLSDIGWKGIYAMNISEAYKILQQDWGGNKVQAIVLRTHGGVNIDENGNVTAIGTIVDNNSGDSVTLRDLELYINNYKALSKQYPAETKLIESFINIASFVKDGGDFVVGSCHSGTTPAFLFTLHSIIKYRINLYGIWGLSKNTYQPLPNNTAKITRKNTFSDSTMLNSTDLGGNTVKNYAWKFSAKKTNIDMRIKLNDLQLNKDGVKAIEADRSEQPYPKIENESIRLTVPPLDIPQIPNQ